MANKRDFKKSVEALSSALVDEMMASYYTQKEADRDKISQAIAKIVAAMGKAKKVASKTFDKKIREFEHLAAYNNAKAQFTKENYDKAIAEYNEALGEALKDYNEGMPKKEQAN